jgi:hypothetical protein
MEMTGNDLSACPCAEPRVSFPSSAWECGLPSSAWRAPRHGKQSFRHRVRKRSLGTRRTTLASAACGCSKTRHAGIASSGVPVLGLVRDAVPPRRDRALAWGLRDGRQRSGAAVRGAALPSASSSTAASIFAYSRAVLSLTAQPQKNTAMGWRVVRILGNDAKKNVCRCPRRHAINGYGRKHMYTLMKCKRSKAGRPAPGATSAYVQVEVAQYADFDDAITARDTANVSLASRHYVMNESGREYYDGTWIQ